ncbi:sugar nucleotide-binding protein [Ornithinibacillus halotolerans]|nr:sugar nucleotide-binding protein [Ornithinibacillus halotolerans]
MLIIGATGFLGSTLFGFAKERGIHVLGTSRYTNKHPQIIEMNVMEIDSIKQVISEFLPDVVVWTLLSRDEEDILINIGLTNLLSVLSPKAKLIFLSTDALFLDGKGNYTEIDEPTPFPENAALSTYVNAKIHGETKTQELHKNHVIIRTGPLYGRDYHHQIEQRTQRVLREIQDKNVFLAASNLYKTFVHVEDLANAILELSIKNYQGIIHVGPDQKTSYYMFYKTRLKDLGYDERAIQPLEIDPTKQPFVPLDSSLNTEKARSLLDVKFRTV